MNQEFISQMNEYSKQECDNVISGIESVDFEDGYIKGTVDYRVHYEDGTSEVIRPYNRTYTYISQWLYKLVG